MRWACLFFSYMISTLSSVMPKILMCSFMQNLISLLIKRF